MVDPWEWARALALEEASLLQGYPWWGPLHREMRRSFGDLDPCAVTGLPEGQDPGALTYGETPAGTTYQLLRFLNLAPGSRIVDLGSGRGLVVLVAGLLGYQASGIELIEVYVERARQAGASLDLAVTFTQGNFLETAIPAAELYFVCSTAFPEDLRETLETRLAEAMPPASRVVTLDWHLADPRFAVEEAVRLPVSWGPSTFLVHRLVTQF